MCYISTSNFNQMILSLPDPLGKKSLPTILSKTEDFPELCHKLNNKISLYKTNPLKRNFFFPIIRTIYHLKNFYLLHTYNSRNERRVFNYLSKFQPLRFKTLI